MGSRKEEERNEKIIRGLMKLPPNRRCINCNSVGPQYVCTNFWTFVCMTCSGIHREFTHRVKSVSMSKFISQEVEALQNGGNQRARDIYLKDWDLQRQRLPDSSNVDKIREFIKNVYVDRKYAGGKTFDKPPRDMRVLRNHEDTIRRPSSYHSYSESPPYDNQYEDRRYGKQIAATLSRKPGSDRGFFARKASSFVHSPCHLSDQMFEERFASEDSAPRVSDYSVSSGGDTFKSGTGSPNFHKGAVFGNPNSQPKTETHNFFVDPNSEKDAAGMPHPQRTRSLGNFGSMDYNSMSVKSYNSGSGLDVVSEPEQTAGSHHDKASSFSQSSFPVNYGDLDLFNTPEASASPPIDLFQLPATAPVSSENVFQTAASLMSHGNLHQPSPSSPSVDFFAGFSEQPPAARSGGKSPELPVPKNEGWAMFDTPLHAASGSVTKNLSPAVMPSGDLSVKFDQLQSLNTTMQWPLFENSSALSSVMSSQWQEGSHEGQSSAAANSTQLSPLLSCEEQESWNASNDSAESLSLEPQVVAYSHSATTYLHLGLGISERLVNDGFQTAALQAGFIAANLPNRDGIAPPYAPEEKQSHAAGRKSTNPFDLPYDSEVEQSDMFLDMISLQTALPNAQLPFTFLGGVSQVWFPQNPMIPYIPGTPQGGLAYMSGQAPSSQLSNVPTQGPLPSIGGNPFA